MKKIFILSLFVCIMLCGCTTIEDMQIEDVIKQGTDMNISVYNKFRKGYKYYLPKGLNVYSSTDYNEILKKGKYTYYLYVDGVSYYNKVIEAYEINDNAYVSMPITYEDKYGYLEINELNSGNYFIEIMYNYAKIEVIVRKCDINVTISNALTILSSIKYNDNILKTLLEEETYQFKEYNFTIFEPASKSENKGYLDLIQEDVYEEEEVHDSDLIS